MEVATRTPVIGNLSEKAQKDFELVQRAIAGCQRSYQTLMERYQHSIF